MGGARRYLPACLRRRRGLTLVELVVVVGIIAVVAGLIAGAAFTVRSSALGLQCASNLRQIGMAIQLYIADHQALPLMYYTYWVPTARIE